MALIRTLHAWAGAVLALLLIVLGLSGSLLVLKNDWLRLTLPEARAVVAPTPEVLGAAAEALEKAHQSHLRHVIFAGPELGVHQVFLHGRTYAYAADDGRQVAEWIGIGRPEAFIYELHHFLLAGETGMRVAGGAGLAGALLAVSGLIIWLPGWRRFGIRPWPRSIQRPELLSGHRGLGVLFAAPVFVLCLTGGAMVFYQTTHNWLTAALPGPKPEAFFPPAYPGDVDWPRALAAAQSAYPRARLRVAIWPAFAASPAIIRLKQPGEWAPDGHTEVMIDPSTSRVLGVIDPQALGPGQRLNDAIHPVHAALVGGRVYDLAAFLSGLSLTGLGVLGLWSFLVKSSRRSRARHTLS